MARCHDPVGWRIQVFQTQTPLCPAFDGLGRGRSCAERTGRKVEKLWGRTCAPRCFARGRCNKSADPVGVCRPESDLGAALLDKVSSPIHEVDEAQLKAWRYALGDPATLTAARVNPWIRKHLLAGRRTPKLHPKVRRAIQVLREELTTKRTFSLNYLAGVAGLSPSRFMHVFTDSVGVPVRPYILWLRLQMACGEMMNGANVTEAAHRSGFADAAHLTRTIRRMMGTTPAELVRRHPSTNAAFAESA
jgi:AraC-like DNA-binding protein